MQRFVFAIILTLAAASCHRELTVDDRARIEKAGNPIIREIESYRRQHGAYPHSLEEAHIQNAQTAFGPFRYELHDDECFVLVVGDFARDGFNYLWNSCLEDRAWVVEE